MIKMGLEADFTDMDRVMNRLMGAMEETRIHRIASKIASAQVKKEYKQRFLALTSSTTRWQSRKKFMSGLGPGFLTGTTFNSITDVYDEHMGRVFLAGRWPRGSGRFETQWGHFIEWGSFGLRVKLNPKGEVQEHPSEDLATKEYGNWRKQGPIKWLHLNDNNIQVINDALSMAFDVAVGDVQKSLRPVKDIHVQQLITEASEVQTFKHTQVQEKISGEGYSAGGSLTQSIAESLGEGSVIEGYKEQKQVTGSQVDVMSEIAHGVGKGISQAAKDEVAEWVKKYGKEFGFK